jgi:hypothetical protein
MRLNWAPGDLKALRERLGMRSGGTIPLLPGLGPALGHASGPVDGPRGVRPRGIDCSCNGEGSRATRRGETRGATGPDRGASDQPNS